MNRRQFLQSAAATAALGAGRWAWAAEPPPKRPNIILCMADDQGWGDVSYNGHEVLKTPALDEMAAAGLRLDRFYAAAPVCSPTRGSVMTGRHPNRFGCFSWGRTLRPQEVTLAEALKSAGYVTAHFGKWHLGPVYSNSPVNPGASGFDEWLSAPNFYDNDPILSRQGKAQKVPGESSMVAVDAALDFIRRHSKGDKPFLAVVWFGSPHNPHIATEDMKKPYADQSARVQNYLGELAGIDAAMGKLRRELRAAGLRDNTLVWYCSDNGGVSGIARTGGRAGKGSIYEGGLRVPGIIEWPARIPRPRTSALPAVTSDIYPTLLELVGAKVDKQPPLDGVSLAPLIAGDMTRRPPIGFWDHGGGGISTPSAKLMGELLAKQQGGQEVDDPQALCADAAKIDKQYPEDAFPGHAAWTDWPWKLHRIHGGKGAKKKAKGKQAAESPADSAGVRIELYNLADDPMEKQDLAADQPDRVRTMRTEMEAWLKSVTRSLNGKDY